MSFFGMRTVVMVGLIALGFGPCWAADEPEAPKVDVRKAVDQKGRPGALRSGESLSSIGRPASEGPVFPESPAPTQEKGESLQTQIKLLIPRLAADSIETRDEAMHELEAISHHARAPLERALDHENPEVSRRAKLILDKFPPHTHAIVDAVGEPIPYARVILTFSQRPNTNFNVPFAEPRVVGDWSDEYGRLAIPKLADNNIQCQVQVQHPDYGWGRYSAPFFGSQSELVFPLTRHGSKLRERSVNGTVVAPDGQPVAAALVQSNHVRTAGEGLINGATFRGDALTDDQGRFSYYLPNVNQDNSRGDIIPPNSRYDITITKPDDDSFFPFASMLPNGDPVRVELPKPTQRHCFRFESLQGGWLEKPEQWQGVHIQRWDEKQNRVVLDAGSLVRGRPILDGKYTAMMVDNGKIVNFEPLIVTRDSPEELLFRLPKPITYRGKVVDGVTGKGIANAIVIGWQSTARNNLALLSEDDWKVLSDSPSAPPSEHPAMKLLGKYYGVQGLVRTDADGQFEIVRPPNQEFYGLMAFNQESVPFKVRIGSLKQNAGQPTDAGDFLLFPAAKVLVTPIFEGDRLSIWPEWLPTSDGQPDWFPRFKAVNRGSDRDIEYGHWLTINEPQPIYVPAGIRLRLRFDSPYNDEWSSAFVDKPVQVEAGASQDLGDLHFPHALPVEVQVISQTGKPVEGFAIRRKYDAINAWSVAHNTDENGIAFFHVHPNSKGQFKVTDLKGPNEISQAANLAVNFQTTDKASKEPFRIKVTDEQISLLRKEK